MELFYILIISISIGSGIILWFSKMISLGKLGKGYTDYLLSLYYVLQLHVNI